ncbi:MAG TPA: FliH/SctL family protein [Candidatus Atribacteria bacterium]|nr:FliH/SctL family protein [Candidatus Atribacteria bacterium]HPT78046.1 FliH/SctL family protein [Candidatus Atribacteria bacterium]
MTSLLYRLVKNSQVDVGAEKYEIPLSALDDIAIPRGGKESAEDGTESDIYYAESQAALILEQARAQADQILKRAESEATAIMAKAREEGFNSGFEQGRQEGWDAGSAEAEAKYEAMLRQAKEMLIAAHRESREYIRKTRDEITELAALIAESIIRFSIDTRDESIVEMVKKALQQAEEKKMILFRCSPEALPVIRANEHHFRKVCPYAAFSFLEDKGISRLGCIIESEDQVINLEIDRQLDNVIAALKGIGEDNGV